MTDHDVVDLIDLHPGPAQALLSSFATIDEEIGVVDQQNLSGLMSVKGGRC